MRGVGPVRVVLKHASGETSTADLTETNLRPKALPSDQNLLPLNRGDKGTLRWRNSKWMKSWSTQSYEVSDVLNSTSRVDVKHVSGPLRVAAAYALASRLSGVTLLSGSSQSAGGKFPKLGKSRRFTTPFDLMVYGFNPVIPSPGTKAGTTWRSSRTSRDFSIFGVSGNTTVLGTQTVTVRGKQYKAVAIRSRLTQAGHKFGSGTRTAWFAPGQGARQARLQARRRLRLDRGAGQVVARPAASGLLAVARARPPAAARVVAGCGGGEDPSAPRSAPTSSASTRSRPRARTCSSAPTPSCAATRRAPPSAPPRWQGVEADVRRVRDAVAAVSPPPAARDVHDRLLKIYDVDAGLVAETQRMVEYEAAAPATLEPLDRASQTLRRDLRRARTARTQAKALDRFGDTLARRLPPPRRASTSPRS